MKIRIKGNTLRLRLTQTELEDLADEGRVQETTTFGPGQTLIYILERSPEAQQIGAGYKDQQIKVILPDEIAFSWIRQDDQVSITAELENDQTEKLAILIEKDFRCLTERTHEDEADLFPHPKEGQVNC